MDLNEMLVFARVAQTGSFTAAAADLGMPKSTVSAPRPASMQAGTSASCRSLLPTASMSSLIPSGW
jgi:hypothetical protein